MAHLQNRAGSPLSDVRRFLAALYEPTLTASEAFVRQAYHRPWSELGTRTDRAEYGTGQTGVR